MNISVTGHKGEAGSVIIKNMRKKGHECNSYLERGLDGQSTDVVIHAAAKHPNDTVDEILISNIIYQKKVVDDCKNADADFISLSSVSIYNVTDRFINEKTEIAPVDFYGFSKFFGERYAMLKGVFGYSLRLPALLCVNNRSNLMGRIVERLIKGESILLTNPDLPFNSYVDPEDISEFVDFYNGCKSFQAVNFAVNPSLTLYETVCILKELLLSSSIISKGHENGMHRVYHTDKLKHLTGFEFSQPECALERWVNRIRMNTELK